jgi:hypothetical protein
MRTRLLRLTIESCPHDLFGQFELAGKAVRFKPSELTKAFRDGDTLDVVNLHLTSREYARAVVRIAGDVQTIELPDGRSIKRHPDFKVTLLPQPDFKVSR